MQLARTKSDAVAHADGDYKPRIAAAKPEGRKVVIGSAGGGAKGGAGSVPKSNVLLMKNMPVHLTEEIMLPLFTQLVDYVMSWIA